MFRHGTMKISISMKKMMGSLAALAWASFSGMASASPANQQSNAKPTQLSQRVDYQMRPNDLLLGVSYSVSPLTGWATMATLSYGYNLTSWLELEADIELGYCIMYSDKPVKHPLTGPNFGVHARFRPFSWQSDQRPWLHSILLSAGTTLAPAYWSDNENSRDDWRGAIDFAAGYELRTQSGFLLNLSTNIIPFSYDEKRISPTMGFGITVGLGYSF